MNVKSQQRLLGVVGVGINFMEENIYMFSNTSKSPDF